MVYVLKDPRFSTIPCPSNTERSSLLPEFLRIENPVTGHPFAAGSSQFIVTDVLVIY
jgi:hypothetical protein